MENNMTHEDLENDFIKMVKEELSQYGPLEDYFSKSGQKEIQFEEIRQFDDAILFEGAKERDCAFVIERADKTAELLSIEVKEYTTELIESVALNIGIQPEDMLELMQNGLEISEIVETA